MFFESIVFHVHGFKLRLQAEAQPQRTVAMQATAVAEAPTKTYEVGEKLHGFTCVRVEYVKDRLVVLNIFIFPKF